MDRRGQTLIFLKKMVYYVDLLVDFGNSKIASMTKRSPKVIEGLDLTIDSQVKAPPKRMFSETPLGAIKKPSLRPALNCPRLSSMSFRWGSSSFHIVGADTRDLRGPKLYSSGTGRSGPDDQWIVAWRER